MYNTHTCVITSSKIIIKTVIIFPVWLFITRGVLVSGEREAPIMNNVIQWITMYIYICVYVYVFHDVHNDFVVVNVNDCVGFLIVNRFVDNVFVVRNAISKFERWNIIIIGLIAHNWKGLVIILMSVVIRDRSKLCAFLSLNIEHEVFIINIFNIYVSILSTLRWRKKTIIMSEMWFWLIYNTNWLVYDLS